MSKRRGWNDNFADSEERKAPLEIAGEQFGTPMPPCPICKQPDCRLTYEECHRAEMGKPGEQS
jgi:hypothetical protein